MDQAELDRRFVELRQRCLRLAPEEQERALDGFAQVLMLCELPREPGESVALSIGLQRSSEITHLSG